MGFVWTEIKKWAKTHGMEPKKSKDGKYEFEGNSYSDIDSLTTSLYNKLSNNKWKEYQKNYEKNSRKDD